MSIDDPNNNLIDFIAFKFYTSFGKCLKSRYFIANIFYLVYCSAMLFIDFSAVVIGEARLQSVYFQFALLHLITAILYLYSWAGEGYNIFKSFLFLLPDWLNLFGSILYLCSATLYPYQFSSSGKKNSLFDLVQLIELVAIISEFIAAILWVFQWYLDYRKDLFRDQVSCNGKGFTFDDPDLWGNITVLPAAYYYLKYSILVFTDYSLYDTCKIYEIGDIWYFANSIFYLLCSLRDCGMFWFLPQYGRFPNFRKLADEHFRNQLNFNANANANSKILTPSSSSSTSSLNLTSLRSSSKENLKTSLSKGVIKK